jgi:hypothetical protein
LYRRQPVAWYFDHEPFGRLLHGESGDDTGVHGLQHAESHVAHLIVMAEITVALRADIRHHGLRELLVGGESVILYKSSEFFSEAEKFATE